VEIRFLFFPGCPYAESALKVLREALTEEGLDANVEVIAIETEEQAQRYKFLGSPSIQINGQDIEETRRKDPPFFGCRIYEGGGEKTGIPPKAMILEAIKRAKDVTS